MPSRLRGNVALSCLPGEDRQHGPRAILRPFDGAQLFCRCAKQQNANANRLSDSLSRHMLLSATERESIFMIGNMDRM